MTSSTASQVCLRQEQEWVTPIAWTKLWYLFILLAHLALFTPYITHAVPQLNKMGLFPVRPLFYMLFMIVVNLALLWRKSPDFTLSGLLLLLLLGIRAFDATFLQRYGTTALGASPALGYAGCFLMGIVVFASIGVFHKTTFRPALWVSAASILVLAGSVLAEFLGYGKFTTVEGRAAGFAGDANDACMAMNLMLGVYLSLSKRFWWNIALMAVVLVGVLPTLSRGGFLNFSLIALTFTVLNLRRYPVQFIAIGLAAVPLLAGGIGLVAAKSAEGGTKDKNAESRLSGLFGGDVGKLQSGERIKDLQDGINAAAEKPVFGLGSGAGQGLYQPHNQFVTTWLDMGLGAALLYAAIIVFLAFRSITSGFTAIYCIIPLTLYIGLAQTLLDDYAYYYAAAVVIYLTSSRFLALRLHRPERLPNHA